MITLADLDDALNPEGSATKFSSARALSYATTAIASAAATVKGYMPEEYRTMLTTISGYILTRDALVDEVSWSLPSWIVVTDSLAWRNLETVWHDRKLVDAEAHTIDANNLVTFETAAEAHDIIVMEILHESEAPLILKNLCVQLAKMQVVNDIPRLVSRDDRDLILGNHEFVRSQLNDLRRGMLRIDEWDELKLIREHETITRQGPGMLDPRTW